MTGSPPEPRHGAIADRATDPEAGTLRERMGWLIRLRWLAIGGVVVATFTAEIA